MWQRLPAVRQRSAIVCLRLAAGRAPPVNGTSSQPGNTGHDRDGSTRKPHARAGTRYSCGRRTGRIITAAKFCFEARFNVAVARQPAHESSAHIESSLRVQNVRIAFRHAPLTIAFAAITSAKFDI
ncbi:hypothetical protein RR46_05676 [Papilio xuthus]|uniref:Uncharacterized protein n=1 Tax=Papilio xuthus TaxID=66420 RepID=A0A194PWC7_PAPXU|nr:hypothetical protein RR46_05676 [Papilio xuthus]